MQRITLGPLYNLESAYQMFNKLYNGSQGYYYLVNQWKCIDQQHMQDCR